MASRKPKVAQTYRDRHPWPSIERVGHQRVNPGCSTGLAGLRWTGL